jgi:hypothetical protein
VRLDERLICPQMALWAPEDETLLYPFAFKAEMEGFALSVSLQTHLIYFS